MKGPGQSSQKEGICGRVDSRECLSGVYVLEVVLIQSQDPQTGNCLEWLNSTAPLVLVEGS